MKVCITSPEDANAVSSRNKLIWLLVSGWLAAAFVFVAQTDYDDGVAAYNQGD